MDTFYTIFIALCVFLSVMCFVYAACLPKGYGWDEPVPPEELPLIKHIKNAPPIVQNFIGILIGIPVFAIGLPIMFISAIGIPCFVIVMILLFLFVGI